MVNYLKVRSSRNRVCAEKSSANGKLYIQIIVCVAIICSFMLFKDTTLPNGKTPKEYANNILSTTVNIPEIIARFKEDAVLPAGAEVINP